MVTVTEHAWSVSADGSPGPTLLSCLEAAIAAPSIHNTQPWRFRVHEGVIDVYADVERRLDVVDPRGREMMISVGAAVLNLRVAVLNNGRLPLLRLLPEPDEPNLVARVIPSQNVHPDQTVRALAAAIPRRRTNRRPFADIPVPEEVVDELSAAARVEGGILAVADAIGREAVLGLIRTADGRQRTSLPYQEELGEWTAQGRERRDGIPAAAFGPWDVMETLPLRDFGIGQPATNRRMARFEPEPTLVVLYTPGDGAEQWLRAGQALERVLLTATVRGLATTLLTQALELPDLRTLLADPRSGRVAQAVIRLGYGPASAVTPRRPVSEVLIHDRGR